MVNLLNLLNFLNREKQTAKIGLLLLSLRKIVLTAFIKENFGHKLQHSFISKSCIMKNVFSFFLLLFSNFAFGQIEWVGNHIFSDSTADILKTSQGHFALLHSNGAGFTVFDGNGNMVLENTQPIFEGYGYSSMVEFQDSSLFFVTGGVACDVFVGYFYKYDENWNEIENGYTYGGGIIAKFSDNSVAIAEQVEGGIRRITDSGTVLWTLDLPWVQPNDMVVNQDDVLLLATNDGLFRITSDGTVIDTLTDLILDRIEILPNGNLLTQQGDVLQLYDADFTPLAFFQQPGNALKDLSFTQNEIAVLTSAPSVVKLDLGLNTIGTTPLAGHNQSFTSVAFAENGYMVGGGESFGDNGHESKSAFIKEFKYDGSTSDTNADAALVEVSTSGSIQIQHFENWYDLATVPDITVIVKNNGPSVINSLNVNIHFPNENIFLAECPLIQAFSKNFENLNLQPNATMQLAWGDLEFWLIAAPIGGQLELCFWTSLPNHHLETNNDNDVACTQVLISDAHEPKTLAFHHYFNPATDELILETQPELKMQKSELFVFNTAGQMVLKSRMDQQRQALDLGQLPDGAYFLQILSGRQQGLVKILKY